MTDWLDDAKCQEIGLEPYFQKNVSESMARFLCGGCPVQAECLEWALETDSRYGVWGGMSETRRRRLHIARENHGNRRG